MLPLRPRHILTVEIDPMATATRTPLRRLIPSIAAISFVLAAPLARAQSPEAESLFDQADALEKSGKLAEACEAFEASNRIEARAGTLIRLGDCRERTHKIASAWSAYKDALTRVKDAKKRDIATAKVADLTPRLSYLTIHVANQIAGLEVTRDGHPLDPAEWNHPLALDGGTYAIEAHAPGHIAWKGSAVVPDEKGQVTIEVPALAEDKQAPPVAGTPPTPQPLQPLPPLPEPSAWTGKRKVAVLAAGVAVLAVAGGVVLAEMSKSKQDDADKLCPQMICATDTDMMTASADISTAQSRALDANIAFGFAGAAAIAAGVLWLTGAPEQPALAVTGSPGTATLTISGRF
jgi:hypothetical protein